MKRSKIVISGIVTVIVVLALVCTGAAYFSGKQYEQKITQEFEKANQQLALSPVLAQLTDFHLRFSTRNYQRGVFSSRFQVVISDDGQQPLLVLNQTLQHGPFPLAELAHFNFLPGTTLETTPATEGSELNDTLKRLAQGKPFFTVRSRLNYFNSGNNQATIHIPPLHYQSDNAQFDSAGIVIKIASNSKGKIPETISNINDWMQMDPSGTVSIESGKVTYVYNSQTVLSIDSSSQNFQLSMNDKVINQNIKFAFKGLTVEQQLIGDGDVSAQINNIDKSALTEYLRFLENAEGKGGVSDVQQKSTDTRQQILDLQVAMIKNADIIINPLSLRNDKGTLKYRFHLSLNDASRLSKFRGSLPILKDVLKSLDSKLELPKAATIKLVSQIICISDKTNCQQAEKDAAQQVDMLAVMGQSFHLTTLKDDIISSDIHLQDGMVTINGETIPLEKFIVSLLGGQFLPNP